MKQINFKKTFSAIKNFDPKIIRKKEFRKKILRTLLSVLVYGTLGIILSVILLFVWFAKDLPTPQKIANRKPAVSTKIYDRTGQILLYETGDTKRTVVPSDQISQYLKDATVATEDKTFYKNYGFDAKAVAVAAFEKLIGRTAVMRGGSTITQQYVKNSFLTSDRSITRKIKELILSIEMEFMYKKDQILTMYLNEVPYGSATAGAEAASQQYYGKSAKDLTLAEAATLAGIPQAPTYYSPYGTHVDSLVKRKSYVLELMVKTGKITVAQADEARKTDTTTLNVAIKPRHDSMLAPHFAMYVLENIADKYGDEMVQKQGLKVITTLDFEKQKIAETAVTNGAAKLGKYGGSNAALVAEDPKTGQILSMVGSKDYFDTSIDGNVNITDSLRQPGSSFKPIAYATALKKPDFSPSKILFDVETDFGGGYIPHNYNGRNNGPVTMRFALANSLNVPAVKVMGLAGIDNVLRTAQDLGITSLTQTDRYGLSLVLGAGEVRPVEMAGAFSVFATGGTKNEVTPILKISDSEGKTLYDWEKEKKPGVSALDPQIAYEISSILSDNNTRSAIFGAHSALYFPNRTVAAKTGTTSSFKDAWAVGYTPSIAVAVWTGNSDATAMKNGADGSVLAAPIFHDFIVNALAKTPDEAFSKPDGIQEVTVEKYSNKLPNSASREFSTDIFASWQVPKDKDNVNNVVSVCKGTDLLAPDTLPENLKETKVYADLHSEKPDNPNWENPVRAWAAANGMTASVPKDYCDANTLTPAITISSPANGTTVTSPFTVTTSVKNGVNVSKVEFLLDDTAIGDPLTTAPFTKTIETASGQHKLSVVLTDSNGTTATDNINVTVDSTIELKISDLTVEQSNGNVYVSWTTNKSANASITYKQDGTSDSQTATNTDYGLIHNITLANLIHDKKYLFTIESKDATSNQTASTDSFFTTEK